MMGQIALVTETRSASAALIDMLERENVPYVAFDHPIDLFNALKTWQPSQVVLDLRDWTIREQAMTLILRERLPRAIPFMLLTSLPDLGSHPPKNIDRVFVRPWQDHDVLSALRAATRPFPLTASLPA